MTGLTSSSVIVEKFLLFEKYYPISPLVFSFDPLAQLAS